MSDPELINRLEFVDAKEREYFSQAQLGQQTRDFLISPVGRYLHGRAKEELDICKDEILECNPHSLFGRRKIAKIQRRANHASSFIRWCTDAIQEGDFAYQELSTHRG